MKPVRLAVAVFFTILFAPLFAFAQAASPPVSGNAQLLTILLGIIGTPVTILLSWYAHRLISAYEAKTGAIVSEADEAKLQEWLKSAVTLAEQRGVQALQNSGQTLSGPAKLNVATTYLADNIKRTGADKVAQAHLESLVDAFIAKQKVAGTMPVIPVKVVTSAPTVPVVPPAAGFITVGLAVVLAIAGLAFSSIAFAGCATIGPAICGQGKTLYPPDAKACSVAFLKAAASLVGDVAACRVELVSSACVDAVLGSLADLAACEPTCGPAAPVAGKRMVAGSYTVHVSPAVLRTNIMESLKATSSTK
jgi:hypothetical protein